MNHVTSLMQNVKKSNPGIAFTEVGRVLGERWNKLTGISPIPVLFVFFLVVQLHCFLQVTIPALLLLAAEEKAPYEAKARADKKRYSDEISGYKNPQLMDVDSADESDGA